MVSQPFDGLVSQLPKPVLHAPSVHTPAAQVSAAFARLQAAPQPPQSVSVLMFRSQPFEGSPSQLAKPDEQTGVHAPDTHEVVPWVLLHALVHVPQLVVVLSGASHPFGARPSQFPKPVLQVKEQALPLHDDTAFAALQVVPHAPQLLTLVALSVSHPSAGFPLQSRNVPLQTGVHAPATQLVVPWVFVQVFRQPPQLLMFVLVFVSQPFAGLPSQLPNPVLHVGLQAPPEHTVVPWGFVQG